MALNFSNFSALIVALADKYHDGHPYPMAERVGVSIGTVQMWHKGTIKAPTIPTLRLLADAYGLELADLIDLVSKPTRRRRPVRGMLAALMALLGAAISGGPVEAATLAVAGVGCLGAEQSSPLPLLAKCPPIRDIMSRWWSTRWGRAGLDPHPWARLQVA
jgi:transcriptional regulator with XRE-family HTH domain